MEYIASCSFGKDSLAAIIECERRGLHIDRALYCRIMFDAETSAELPEHDEFIHCKAAMVLKQRLCRQMLAIVIAFGGNISIAKNMATVLFGVFPVWLLLGAIHI